MYVQGTPLGPYPIPPQIPTPMDLDSKINTISNNVVQSHNILVNLLRQSQLQNLSVIDYVKHNAKVQSVEYIEAKMQEAVLFTEFKDFWTHALSKAKSGGVFAEFGVWSGVSINFIADKFKNDRIYGFDSFEGLKEDWKGCIDHPAGKFDKGGQMPEVRPNVKLVKGWFDQSIPGWLAGLEKEAAGKPLHFSYLHVDCDTYESTQVILNLLGHLIVPGTVVVFDEYLGNPGWKIGEFKAWQEFVQSRGIKYRYMGCCTQQVSVMIEQA